MGGLSGVNFLVIDWGMTGVPRSCSPLSDLCWPSFPLRCSFTRPAVSWRLLAAVGAVVSLGQFGFLYVAMDAGMPPGLAALVLQGQVVLTVLIAVVALRELPTSTQVAGVLLGTVGLVVVGVGRDPALPLVAFVLCLLAALSWAAGNIVTRAATVPTELGLTVWSAAVVPLPLLALSLVVDGPTEVVDALTGLTWRPLVATTYTVVLASLVGYGIFNTLLSRSPSAAVVPWALLAPVVAMTGAWVQHGASPTAAEATGGLALLAGVLVASAAPVKRRPAPGPAAGPARCR